MAKLDKKESLNEHGLGIFSNSGQDQVTLTNILLIAFAKFPKRVNEKIPIGINNKPITKP